jgi:hypothetical protein
MSLDVSVYEVLRDWLAADAVLAPQVTTGTSVRIRPGSLPKGSLFPAIVVKRVGGDDGDQMHTEEGLETGAGTGWVKATFQTEVWAADLPTSETLGTLVAKRLRSLTGATHMGMRFGIVKRTGDYSANAPSIPAEVRIQDFEVNHRE